MLPPPMSISSEPLVEHRHRLQHAEVDEPGLLDAGDDLDLDAGLVAGPARGTRRGSPPRAPRSVATARIVGAVAVGDPAEAVERGDAAVDGVGRRARFMSPEPEPSRTISFSRAMTSNAGRRFGRSTSPARATTRWNELVPMSMAASGRSLTPSLLPQPGLPLHPAGGGDHGAAVAAPRLHGSVRSIGPDTLTAATTRPSVAHRRGHRGHAGLALAHALDPPAAADRGRRRRRARRATGRPSPCRAAGRRRRHDRAQPVRATRATATHTRCVAVAHVELHALAGVVPQPLERRPGGPASGRASAAARPSRPAAARGRSGPSSSRRTQAVGLERHGQPVGGRPGEAGGLDQLGQRPGAGLHRVEHGDRLVEHADAAYTRSTRRD